MPGRKSRTNPFLILLLVLLCITLGTTFTQSSANPSPVSEGKMPDMFVAEDPNDSAFSTDGTAETSDDTEDSSESTENSAEVTPTPTPVPTATPTPAYSPEAEKGVWTPSGSNWMFLIDSVPFTGWLTDTDGKQYFFNQEGIMQTGWLEYDGKRYYLNMDGIMQTGTITVDGETYELLADGSLKGYDTKKETASTEKKSEKGSEEGSKETAEKPDKKSADKETEETTNKETAKTEKTATKTIALTFDDGPSSYTERLLDCLEENDAKATFFMVGTEIANFPDTVKRMQSLGCELGNHTYKHTDLTSLDPEGMSSEIGATDQALLELVGHGATVLRPPYGSINDSVTSTVGTPMILWSVDTLDWKTLDVQKTVDTVLSEAEDGGIILMHDIYSETVDAAEIIIPKLIEQGYELVTVSELAAAHGTELQTGIAYGSFQ